LLDLLTPDDLLAQVMILRSVRQSTVILVEGDSDCDVLDPHLASAHCETIPAGSKVTVLKAVAQALRAGISRVLGVVDRDFEGTITRYRRRPNIFVSQHYDLGVDVLRAPGVEEHLLRECLGKSAAAVAESLSSAAVDVCYAIGRLRLMVHRDRLAMSVRRIPVHEVIDADNKCDLAKLIGVVGGRAGLGAKESARVVRLIRRELRSSVGPPERVICSHDLYSAYSALLKAMAGKSIKAAEIARLSHACLHGARLRSLKIYSDLEAWASVTGVVVWA
jgi:hypothetical protein